jgi:DNA-binding transcriptional LysR family regulator
VNLNELQTFREIVTRGSLTEAGKVLGLTQSGVTRQLQRLEQDLGTSLVRRDTTPVLPTVAGERFLSFAEQVLRDFDQLKAELAAEAGNPAITLAASTTPGDYLVPALLVDFFRGYPGWRVQLSVTDSAQATDQVEAGSAQVGFVGSIADRPALRFVPFMSDELVLVARHDHPLADRGVVTIDECAAWPIVLREAGSGTLNSLRQLLEARGQALPPWRVVATLGSTQAVLSAVLAGAGLGFASFRALAPYGGDRLRALRLAGLPLWRQLYIVVRQEAAKSDPVHRFVRAALSWAAYQTS